MNNYKILLVEDDREISEMLKNYLTAENYEIICAFDGQEACDKFDASSCHLVLLDLMIPKISGIDVMQHIRKTSVVPIMILSAKDTEGDKMLGLGLGADDYITKPFEIIELLARVENVLRRFHKVEQVIQIGNLEINVVARTVKKNGRDINLTIKEFDLLLLFMRNPDRALYREMIYEQVWDSPYMGDSRTVDLHVQRLRRKAGLEQQIESVYKVGYRFRSSVT